MLRLTLATLTLSSLVMAQVVSPVGYGDVEAWFANSIPFGSSTATYQQIHGDLRGTQRTISSIAFRRDGIHPSAFPAQRVTMDVWMGDSDVNTVSGTFSNNIIGTPLQVVTGRTFNFPDHSARPIQLPAPFTLILNFDRPYAYRGTLDLLFEIRVTANIPVISPSARLLMDAAIGDGTPQQTVGRAIPTGNGCTTVNGSMELRWNGFTSSQFHSVVFMGSGGPPSAQASLLVGAAATLTLPGLCASIHTTGSYFTLQGTTNSTGFMTIPTRVAVPYDPTLVGLQLTAQAAAVDATQAGLPLALSNALTASITDVGGLVHCARIYDDFAQATSGLVQRNFALVTQFR